MKVDADHRRQRVARKRALTNKRVAKHRSPQRKGWATTYLDYTDTLVAAMVRWHWLPNQETHSKAEIRQAASQGLAEAAEEDAAEIKCNALRCPRCGRLKAKALASAAGVRGRGDISKND